LHVKNGIKRYSKIVDEGKGKDTKENEDKHAETEEVEKIEKNRDEYGEVDKTDAGPNTIPQSTQNDKNTSEDELEEMLSELEKGVVEHQHINNPNPNNRIT